MSPAGCPGRSVLHGPVSVSRPEDFAGAVVVAPVEPPVVAPVVAPVLLAVLVSVALVPPSSPHAAATKVSAHANATPLTNNFFDIVMGPPRTSGYASCAAAFPNLRAPRRW